MGSPSALRKLNDRAALYALLESGPLSRLDLERAINVSQPAAAELLRRLEESGLARRAGHRAGGPGPQAQLWTVNERAAFAAGMDVNEWGIRAAIADLGGTVLAEDEIVVPPADDATLAVKKLLGTLSRRAGIRRAELRQLAVGISGSVDPETGLLSHADHIAQWTGFDVAQRLSKLLGMPVTVENDVKLVLRDEAIRGRAAGCTDVLLLWMSHGIALAAMSGGRLHHGFHGSAGEIGFVPVGRGGPIANSVLSTLGVLALAHEHELATDDPVKLLHRMQHTDGPERDRFLSEFAARIVDVLAAPVAVLDPELIILGGDTGVAGGELLAERVTRRLNEVLLHRPRVAPGTGDDDAVRQGALDEALRRLRESVFANARDHAATTGPIAVSGGR